MSTLKRFRKLFLTWLGFSLLFVLITPSALSAQIKPASGIITEEVGSPFVGITVLGPVLKLAPVANINGTYYPIIPKDAPLLDFLI
jgi:hypothetical protein